MKMLFTTLAIALAILASEHALAVDEGNVSTQMTEAKASTWRIAPSLGLTSFQLKTDAHDYGSKSGMSAGAAVFMATGMENLDFETGLQYLQAGGKDGNFLASYEVNLDYLAVPAAARYRFLNFGADNKNFVYVRGGLAAAFLVSAKQKLTFLGESADGDIKDQVNSLDLMAVAGLGGSYAMGNDQHILYELNYVRGTQKVIKDQDSHSEGYALNLMYSIPL